MAALTEKYIVRTTRFVSYYQFELHLWLLLFTDSLAFLLLTPRLDLHPTAMILQDIVVVEVGVNFWLRHELVYFLLSLFWVIARFDFDDFDGVLDMIKQVSDFMNLSETSTTNNA